MKEASTPRDRKYVLRGTESGTDLPLVATHLRVPFLRPWQASVFGTELSIFQLGSNLAGSFFTASLTFTGLTRVELNE